MPELLSKSFKINDEKTLELPSNLEQIGPGHRGRTAGALPLLALVNPAGSILALGSFIGMASGGYNSDATEFAKSIEYTAAPKEAGVQFDGSAKVLKRDDGRVDAVISGTINFNVDGSVNDELTEIVYQDACAFSIAPDGTGWSIDSSGVAPLNENAQIVYTWIHGWKASVGMKGVGKYDDKGPGGSEEVTVGAEATFTTQTSTRIPEFGVMTKLQTPNDGVTWSVDMRQSYANGPHSYSIHSPEDLIINGVATKWLKDPPAIAKSTFSLPVLATFSSSTLNPTLSTITLKFTGLQRIMFAYVAGRWGAKGARLGGSGIVVPGTYDLTAKLVIDLVKRDLQIKDLKGTFSRLKA